MAKREHDRPTLKLPIDTWPVICGGTILAALFFLFGVKTLIASYESTDPSYFLMLFFSSSMIILVNGTIFFILVVMGFRRILHHGEGNNQQDFSSLDDNDTKPF